MCVGKVGCGAGSADEDYVCVKDGSAGEGSSEACGAVMVSEFVLSVVIESVIVYVVGVWGSFAEIVADVEV